MSVFCTSGPSPGKLHDLHNREVDHDIKQQGNLLVTRTMGICLCVMTGMTTTMMNCNCGPPVGKHCLNHSTCKHHNLVQELLLWKRHHTSTTTCPRTVGVTCETCKTCITGASITLKSNWEITMVRQTVWTIGICLCTTKEICTTCTQGQRPPYTRQKGNHDGLLNSLIMEIASAVRR